MILRLRPLPLFSAKPSSYHNAPCTIRVLITHPTHPCFPYPLVLLLPSLLLPRRILPSIILEIGLRIRSELHSIYHRNPMQLGYLSLIISPAVRYKFHPQINFTTVVSGLLSQKIKIQAAILSTELTSCSNILISAIF